MDHELERHVCQNFDIIKRIGKGVCIFIQIIILGLRNSMESEMQEAWYVRRRQKDFWCISE